MKTFKIVIHYFFCCKQWVQFCKNNQISKIFLEKNFKILSQRVICSEHFEESKYNNPSKKIRLIPNAIPSIKKNSISNTIISLSNSSLNSDSLESNSNVIDIESQKDYSKEGIL
jgi:hypothetical protein